MSAMTTDDPPPDTPSKSTSDPEPKALERLYKRLTSPAGRLIRYLLVLVIVGAAVYFSLTGWFQVCEVVESTKDGFSRTCSGPNLTSAGVLAAVVFVLLLLWPDLSEFSAFGVTLKRLVEKVDEKATHIDGTTTETKSRIETLSSAVSTQGGDISARLSVIQNDLTSLGRYSVAPDTAPARPGPPSPTPAPRWDQFDRTTFLNACRGLSGPEDLDAAIAELDAMIGDIWWPILGDLGTSGRTASFEGVVLELFRLFRAQWDGNSWEDPHRAAEIDAILRSIERMLLALLSGRPVDTESLRTAAGVLLLLHKAAAA